MNSLFHVAVAGSLLAILGSPAAGRAAPAPEGVLRWTGTGVQVYACKRDGAHAAWSFERPDAKLTNDAGQDEGEHGAGPHWTANDGSVVYGAVAVSMPAPIPGAVPWLVLRASKHEGSGQMSRVGFIMRTDTDGGAAPAAGCDLAHDGAEARVAYHAIYTFLLEPSQPG